MDIITTHMETSKRASIGTDERFCAPCVRSIEYSHSTKILIFLRRGETNQQSISGYLHEDPGTIARELRRMRDEGLVEMRKDTRGDAEYSLNLYSLTDRGRLLSLAATLAWEVSDGRADEARMSEAIAALEGIVGPYDLDDMYPEPDAIARKKRRSYREGRGRPHLPTPPCRVPDIGFINQHGDANPDVQTPGFRNH